VHLTEVVCKYLNWNELAQDQAQLPNLESATSELGILYQAWSSVNVSLTCRAIPQSINDYLWVERPGLNSRKGQNIFATTFKLVLESTHPPPVERMLETFSREQNGRNGKLTMHLPPRHRTFYVCLLNIYLSIVWFVIIFLRKKFFTQTRQANPRKTQHADVFLLQKETMKLDGDRINKPHDIFDEHTWIKATA
jgi:hypothetical protein